MAKELKVGLIGTGGIAHTMHLPGWAACPRGEIVACYDRDLKRAEEAAQKFNIPRVCKTVKELLAIKEIAAVDVCTPNCDHKPSTMAALAAGKHVFCEKPMAMNSREGQAMISAARKAKKKLMIGLHNRYRADIGVMHDLVAAGRLGKIYYARSLSVRRRGVPSWGVFGQKKLQGGGPLIDIGVHAIDMTWYLMGKPRPVSVSGQYYETIGKTPGHHGMLGDWDWKTYDVEDFAVALVRFENGAVMNIESAFCVNLPEDKLSAEIVGDKGGATLNPLRVYIEESGYLMNCEPQYVKEKAPPHHQELWAFADAILDNKPVPIPGEEAIVTQKIIDALYESSRLGREVRIK